MNRKNSINGVLVTLILVVGVAFFALDGTQYLNLAYMQEVQVKVSSFYAESRYLVLFLFGLSYTLASALSFPGAGVMTVAAGGFFGLIDGTIVVSIASTCGASLAFLLSRTLFREWVLRKFADKLVAVRKGVAKEGAFYLFTLRLIPAFPFFFINTIMGLTDMKLRTFFWVSQVGMLPATLVLVNAGRELAKIDSLAEIFSPPLIASLCLFGVFPLLMKKVVKLIMDRRKQNES